MASMKKFVLKQDASKLTDEQLIAEFKKRFIVPQFWTKERVAEQIEEYGYIPDEKKIEELVETFEEYAYNDVDDILKNYIEMMGFEFREEEE